MAGRTCWASLRIIWQGDCSTHKHTESAPSPPRSPTPTPSPAPCPLPPAPYPDPPPPPAAAGQAGPQAGCGGPRRAGPHDGQARKGLWLRGTCARCTAAPLHSSSSSSLPPCACPASTRTCTCTLPALPHPAQTHTALRCPPHPHLPCCCCCCCCCWQVTVISRSSAKREEACRPDCLGADHFLVSREEGEMAGAAGTLDGIIDTLAGGWVWVGVWACVSMHVCEGDGCRGPTERELGGWLHLTSACVAAGPTLLPPAVPPTPLCPPPPLYHPCCSPARPVAVPVAAAPGGQAHPAGPLP